MVEICGNCPKLSSPLTSCLQASYRNIPQLQSPFSAWGRVDQHIHLQRGALGLLPKARDGASSLAALALCLEQHRVINRQVTAIEDFLGEPAIAHSTEQNHWWPGTAKFVWSMESIRKLADACQVPFQNNFCKCTAIYCNVRFLKIRHIAVQKAHYDVMWWCELMSCYFTVFCFCFSLCSAGARSMDGKPYRDCRCGRKLPWSQEGGTPLSCFSLRCFKHF